MVKMTEAARTAMFERMAEEAKDWFGPDEMAFTVEMTLVPALMRVVADVLADEALMTPEDGIDV